MVKWPKKARILWENRGILGGKRLKKVGFWGENGDFGGKTAIKGKDFGEKTTKAKKKPKRLKWNGGVCIN